MRYQAARGYVVRQLLDEYLLVPVGSPGAADSRMGIMNPMGAFLWEQLQTARTLEELTSEVCAEFEVDASTAEADIREFLNELEKKHCLITVDAEQRCGDG